MKPNESVMLIIDMEKGFVEPGAALCIAGAKATVPLIQNTADELRKLGVKIIFVKRIYAPDGSNVEIPRWRDLCKRGYKDAAVLGPDTVGINSIEEPEGLHVDQSDEVIIKPRFSAFFGTNLKNRLDELGIKNVILAGTTTPNCIRSTAYDAVSYDLEPVILDGCCSSVTPEVQEANLLDMERIGMKVVREKTAEGIAATLFGRKS